MNEKKYIYYLERYSQWLKTHKDKSKEELAERETHAKEMQKYDKARLMNMTADDMGRIIYVFEVQTSGSIDSLILNLMKAKNNKAVQGIVAVSDAEQIEKIRKEVESLDDIKKDIKYWDYTEVLEVHEALQKANESINKLGLVPVSL